jgi:transposase
MTAETGYGVLTDAQWAALAPLIAQCRPPHKTEHKNLRRTIEAIIWRHENGAKWRSIPPHLGPWWMAAQTFNRWSHHGVWDRLLELAQQRTGFQLGMAFLDGTTIRPSPVPSTRLCLAEPLASLAHQKAAGAAKKGDLQRSGTSVRRLAAPAAASPPRPPS